MRGLDNHYNNNNILIKLVGADMWLSVEESKFVQQIVEFLNLRCHKMD